LSGSHKERERRYKNIKFIHYVEIENNILQRMRLHPPNEQELEIRIEAKEFMEASSESLVNLKERWFNKLSRNVQELFLKNGKKKNYISESTYKKLGVIGFYQEHTKDT